MGSQNTGKAWMWSSVHGLSLWRLVVVSTSGDGLRMKARVPEVLGGSGGLSGDELCSRGEQLGGKTWYPSDVERHRRVEQSSPRHTHTEQPNALILFVPSQSLLLDEQLFVDLRNKSGGLVPQGLLPFLWGAFLSLRYCTNAHRHSLPDALQVRLWRCFCEVWRASLAVLLGFCHVQSPHGRTARVPKACFLDAVSRHSHSGDLSWGLSCKGRS